MTTPPHGPQRDQVGTYFERAAKTFDTFYDGQRSAFMRAVDERFRADVFERYRITFEELKPLEGATVLDVGCGSGPYLAEAVRRGASRVVGLDMSEQMLDLARSRLAATQRGNVADLVQGEFPQVSLEEVFDYAIVTGVMDYVLDAPTFVTSLHSVLRQKAVLSFPSVHWFRTPFRKVRYAIKRCPVYFYERDSIHALLKHAGFTHVTLTKVPGAGQDYVAVAAKTAQ
jgi:cyclopropane fatty-acyl-phospholipid synthase-like methyltransferase